jgi:hypothetical protein
MSFRSKLLVFVLGAALAVIAGRTFAATALHNGVSVLASAVWGS